MLSELFTDAWPVVAAVLAFSGLVVLYTLARWLDANIGLHALKVRTHTLTLDMKLDFARRMLTEQQHRERHNTPASGAQKSAA